MTVYTAQKVELSLPAAYSEPVRRMLRMDGPDSVIYASSAVEKVPPSLLHKGGVAWELVHATATWCWAVMLFCTCAAVVPARLEFGAAPEFHDELASERWFALELERIGDAKRAEIDALFLHHVGWLAADKERRRVFWTVCRLTDDYHDVVAFLDDQNPRRAR